MKYNYPKDFFLIEELIDANAIENKSFDFKQLRKNNKIESRLLNHGFPIFEEEVECWKKMYQTESDLDSLESYFQRSKKTIQNYIFDTKTNHEIRRPSNQSAAIYAKEIEFKIKALIKKNKEIFKSKADESSSVYILLLKSNKIYVGFSIKKNLERRINQHFKSQGSFWTRKYRPVAVVSILESYDMNIESWITGFLMKEYGIENVRGGPFTAETASQALNAYIKNLPFTF